MGQGYFVMFDSMGVPRAYPVPNVVPTSLSQELVGVPSYNPNTQGNFTDNSSVNTQANDLLELANLHQSLLSGQALISTGTGDDVSKQTPVSVIERPWLEEPDGGVPFDPANSVALPAVGSSGIVVSLTVPFGYDGVINYYSWNFTGGGFVQGSGDIVAQLLRNGTPIRNYDNILVEKGTIAQARKISPLRVYSNQVIALNIIHAANGLLNGNIVGSLVGYFYPSQG